MLFKKQKSVAFFFFFLQSYSSINSVSLIANIFGVLRFLHFKVFEVKFKVTVHYGTIAYGENVPSLTPLI